MLKSEKMSQFVQNWHFKGFENTKSFKAISSELTIQTYQINENTLYLVDKKNLRPFQTYFVVIFHVKIRKNVTISIHFKDTFKTFKSDKMFE